MRRFLAALALALALVPLASAPAVATTSHAHDDDYSDNYFTPSLPWVAGDLYSSRCVPLLYTVVGTQGGAFCVVVYLGDRETDGAAPWTWRSYNMTANPDTWTAGNNLSHGIPLPSTHTCPETGTMGANINCVLQYDLDDGASGTVTVTVHFMVLWATNNYLNRWTHDTCTSNPSELRPYAIYDGSGTSSPPARAGHALCSEAIHTDVNTDLPVSLLDFAPWPFVYDSEGEPIAFDLVPESWGINPLIIGPGPPDPSETFGPPPLDDLDCDALNLACWLWWLFVPEGVGDWQDPLLDAVSDRVPFSLVVTISGTIDALRGSLDANLGNPVLDNVPAIIVPFHETEELSFIGSFGIDLPDPWDPEDQAGQLFGYRQWFRTAILLGVAISAMVRLIRAWFPTGAEVAPPTSGVAR